MQAFVLDQAIPLGLTTSNSICASVGQR